MSRLYATPPTEEGIIYNQSFTAKDGSVYNVLMDVAGTIFVQNFTLTPNVFTNVGSVPAGSKCKSIDAFGRLFMAFNDGVHGTDIPRSFNGQKWNRISQGGPCGNPTFGETIGAAVTLGSMGGGASTGVVSLIATDPHTSTRKVWNDDGSWEQVSTTIYRTITATVASTVGFAVGMSATITGNASFNGAFVISDIVGSTIIFGYDSDSFVSGAGGTLAVGAGLTLARSADIVTAGTSAAHGLQPGDMFTISGVANTSLGSISSAARVNNVITIETAAGNGIRVGSSVIISGVTDSTFDGTWTVTGVISSTIFLVESSNLVDATSSGGTVYGQWNNTQRFVISVPLATSLTYSDKGPDVTTTSSGTISPVGQIAGGERNAVCIFLTDYGFRTPPSVPVKIASSGGKKMVVTSIPIGPSNVVGRIIAFTGIDGSLYRYIPVPVRNNGNVIGTSTVIDDNVSTSAIFDFSDDALLSATAIDIDGSNLFSLKILGNCAGVFSYADRMAYWGDENRAINFQNMGFEGGVNADGTPMGWTVSGAGLSVVQNSDFGDGIQFAAGSTAIISQSCYLDYYGDAILEANTQYTFKTWARQSGSGASVVAEIYDTGAATVLATVTIPIPTATGFISGVFSAKTPVVMPVGAVLRVRITGNVSSVVTLDEFSAIFTDNPYHDTTFDVSYVIDPESVDSVSGVMGATSDPTRIMEPGRMRDNFYFTTEERLHTTKDIAGSEPSGWGVNEVSAKCGSCSMFSMIEGESWLGWASKDGARIFDGSQPVKITQDFQRFWDQIDPTSKTSVWSVNDSTNRRIYYGVPTDGEQTDKIYMVDYRYAETGQQIEDRGAIRISGFTGKMLVIEMSRKFSPWTIPASAGGFLMTPAGKVPVFSDMLGRSYTLDPTKLHDDDYGTIPSYYVTSPFVSGDQEDSLQLGHHRHLYTFLSVFLSGTGKIGITPLPDALTNAWPVRGPYAMSLNPTKTLEVPLNVAGERCMFRYDAVPLLGSLDAAFSISRMTVTMEPHPMSPVGGYR